MATDDSELFYSSLSFNETTRRYVLEILGGESILKFLRKFNISQSVLWKSLDEKNKNEQKIGFLRNREEITGVFDLREYPFGNSITTIYKIEAVLTIYIKEKDKESFIHQWVCGENWRLDHNSRFLMEFFKL